MPGPKDHKKTDTDPVTIINQNYWLFWEKASDTSNRTCTHDDRRKSGICALLYSTQTPINLLGRDILCSLKATIMCTQDGIHTDSVRVSAKTSLGTLETLSTSTVHSFNHVISSTTWYAKLYADQSNADYDEYWDQLINKKHTLITRR